MRAMGRGRSVRRPFPALLVVMGLGACGGIYRTAAPPGGADPPLDDLSIAGALLSAHEGAVSQGELAEAKASESAVIGFAEAVSGRIALRPPPACRPSSTGRRARPAN